MRLAYEQGLLSGKSLNRFQRWALTYMLSVKRWDHEDKEEAFIQHSLAVNDWDRFVELYGPDPLAEALRAMNHEEELPVSASELDDINSFLDYADKKRMVSALEVPGMNDDEGWV